MRLNFINPVQIPIMTEGFLRKDFRFDMYLAYCYGKTLTKFFQISIFTILLTSLTFAAMWPVLSKLDNYSNFIAILGASTFIVGLLIILMSGSIERVKTKLTPNPYNNDGKL